jgi:hypothetical protein
LIAKVANDAQYLLSAKRNLLFVENQLVIAFLLTVFRRVGVQHRNMREGLEKRYHCVW